MTLPSNAYLGKLSLSAASAEDLARNALHPVAEDDTIHYTLMDYLQALCLNTSMPGAIADNALIIDNTTNSNLLISCPPDKSIMVFEIFASVDEDTDLSFIDEDGTHMLAKFYAAQDGQGFQRSSRGFLLPKSKSLFVKSTNSVYYSVDITFSLV